jgi:hypothetical protein
MRHDTWSRGGAAGGEPADRDIFLRIGGSAPHTTIFLHITGAHEEAQQKTLPSTRDERARLSWFHPRSAHENCKPHARFGWAGNVAYTRQPTTATVRWFDVGRTGGLLHMTRAEDDSQPVAISRCRGSRGYSVPLIAYAHSIPRPPARCKASPTRMKRRAPNRTLPTTI